MSARAPHAVAMVRTICIASASAFVIGTTLPLALFARFIADDFGFALALREHGFWGYQREFYQTVNGRFTTVALEMAAVSGGRMATPLVIATGLALLILAATMAVRRVAGRAEVAETGLQRGAIILVALAGLFDVAPAAYQSLIWTPGLLSYGVAVALILSAVASWPSETAAGFSWRDLWPPAAALLAAGCSETSAICQVAAFGVLVVTARGRGRLTAASALAASLVGLALAVTAPGNALRRGLLAGLGFKPQPLADATISMLRQLGPDLYGTFLRCAPYLLLVAAILASSSEREGEIRSIDVRVLASAVLIPIGVTAAVLLAGYWSLGTTPPARALFVSKSWIFGSGVMAVIALRQIFRGSRNVHLALTVAVIIGLLTGPLRNPQQRIDTLANARAFAKATDEVDRFARTHPGTSILVNIPRSYEGLDVVSRSAGAWTNIAMARYYGLQSVEWRPIPRRVSLAPDDAGRH